MQGPAPTQSAVLTALRSFLLAYLPAGIEVVEAQANRVPEVKAQDFVVMTPLFRGRLETNVDEATDASFEGYVSGTSLTVTAVNFGAIIPGNALFGVGVTGGTTIVSQTSGTPGGAGAYTVSPSQSVSLGPLAAGYRTITQQTEITVQLDIHGPSSGENAQTISTLFRDPVGTEFFATTNPDIAPLYTSDPRQAPFMNGEQQYEFRWSIDVLLQASDAISGLPQQFADQLVPTLIDAEIT